MSTIRQRKEEARLAQPLPPLEETLALLNALSVKQYETKARAKNAIKLSHLALADTLQMLKAFSAHENLVSKGVVDKIHRDILHRLKLDEKKA
jgi:hypothetical protein